MAAEIASTRANNSTTSNLIAIAANLATGQAVTSEDKSTLLKLIFRGPATAPSPLDVDGLKQLIDEIPIAEEGEVITPEYHNTIRAVLLALVDIIVQLDERTRTVPNDGLDKTVALSNARKLALGIIMYSEDFDGAFPTPNGIKDKILPYVKDNNLFTGFTYTYAGGPTSAITNPAQTIIGFVVGNGGRASISADGHVAWMDQQSSSTPTSGQGPG